MSKLKTKVSPVGPVEGFGDLNKATNQALFRDYSLTPLSGYSSKVRYNSHPKIMFDEGLS